MSTLGPLTPSQHDTYPECASFLAASTRSASFCSTESSTADRNFGRPPTPLPARGARRRLQFAEHRIDVRRRTVHGSSRQRGLSPSGALLLPPARGCRVPRSQQRRIHEVLFDLRWVSSEAIFVDDRCWPRHWWTAPWQRGPRPRGDLVPRARSHLPFGSPLD